MFDHITNKKMCIFLIQRFNKAIESKAPGISKGKYPCWTTKEFDINSIFTLNPKLQDNQFDLNRRTKNILLIENAILNK